MAKPIATSGDAVLRGLALDVAKIKRTVRPPVAVEITGSRSAETAAVLAQILDALEANGIVDDQTTG